MTNRQRIKNFCKDNDIKLILCECERYNESIYGDSFQYWDYTIHVDIDNHKLLYNSYRGLLSTASDVIEMLDDVALDLLNIRFDNSQPLCGTELDK